MIHMLIGAAARGLAVGAGVSAGATIAQKHLDNGSQPLWQGSVGNVGAGAHVQPLSRAAEFQPVRDRERRHTPGGFVVDLPGSRCRRDELAAVPQRRRDRGRVADKQRRGRCAGSANRESLMQIFEDMFGGGSTPITGCTRAPIV